MSRPSSQSRVLESLWNRISSAIGEVSLSKKKRTRRQPVSAGAVLEDRRLLAAVINEVYVNPTSSPDGNREFVEIRTTTNNEALTDLWLLQIEGDGTAAGVVDTAINLGSLSTGSNGLLLLGASYATLNPWASTTEAGTVVANGAVADNFENGTVTFLLVSGFTGAVGNDLDTNNDGTFETTPWTTIVDSVGWTDGGAGDRVYSAAALVQLGGTPDAATRIVGNNTVNSAAAWYVSDILDPTADGGLDQDYDPARAGGVFPVGGRITPGGVNFSVTAPGVTVTQSGGTTNVTEAGTTDTYTLKLDTVPAGNVEITVTADSQSQVSTDGVNFFSSVILTFSDTTAQTVTVRAIDDAAVEGNHSATITHAITTTGDAANYPTTFTIPSVTVNIADNDTPGVTITQSGGTTSVTEGGATDSYTIQLDSIPAGAVEITVTADSQTRVSTDGTNFFSSVVLSFTTMTPQTVTVRAVDDAAVENAHNSTLTHAVTTTADPNYPLTFTIPNVTVSITDNDIEAATGLFINEVLFNPPGTDAPNEYIEIRGTANYTIPSGVYLVGIEGDTTGAGDVQTIINLSGLTIGANGYLVLRQSGSGYTVDGSATTITATGTGFQTGAGFSADTGTDIENTSVTFMLVQSSVAPTLTDDIDSDNDGATDGGVFGNWTILDRIAVVDNAGDAAYAPIVFSTAASFVGSAGKEVVQTTAAANYVARVGTSTGATAADWFGGGLEGTAPTFNLIASDAYPAPFGGQALNHIGSQNPGIPNVAPTITSGATFDVAEGIVAVTTVTATDANLDTLTYAISGGADAALFSINATTGALTFQAAPNFEAPGDAGTDNVYNVQVSVSDGVNPAVTQDITVTVTNVDEAPAITSGAAFNVAENTTAVTTVTATDPDAGATLTYAISGGADAALFSINSSTGALTFLAAPDFEAPADAGTNNVYDVQVSVSDGVNAAVTQDIAVTVTNVNEAPSITSGAAFNVAENTTAVTTVTATDPDAGATLTYAISGGADAARFSINASTGALQFNVARDFEVPNDAGANNVYDVQISVSDGTSAVTQDIAVTLTNVDEAPFFTGGATGFANENTTSATTLFAVDPDAGSTLSFSITGGADSALFSINAATGALSFLAAPNFEAPTDTGANNIYDVQVSVTSGSHTVAQNVTVTVLNVNEAPSITSGAAFNVAENTTAVTTVTATDPDAGATLTYAISGGADAALFSINASTGALTFLAAPNFEAAADAGTNNVYDVQVSVSDGVNAAVTQDIAVTVTNANETPTITSGAAFNVAENTTAVTTVAATDPDAGTTLTFSISGGADAALFSINASTGALTFLAAPDFEVPTDVGANNVYDVQVSVSDGSIAVTQDIAVTVTNVDETPANTPPTAGTIGNITVRQGAADLVIDLKAVFDDAETTDANLVYSIQTNTNTALFTSATITAGILTLDYNPAAHGTSTITVRATDEGGEFVETTFTVTVNYTLQLLHLADSEAGLLASSTAPNLAALVDAFEDDFANNLTLAGGDNWIPGPFLAAGTDGSVRTVLNSVSGSTISGTIPIAAVDIAILNEIGVEASTIGNHEFDLGSRVFRDSFTPGSGWVGANFPYLSSNLIFSGDSDLNSRFTNTLDGSASTLIPEASTLKGRIAPSAVITKGGQKIGLVGATTQLIEAISSPSGTEVLGFPTGPGPNGETDNMDLLAAHLQPVINELIAEGVNKIVLMSHLQVLANEQVLATKLSGVDIILSAGSNTRLGDTDDVAVAFPGHAANFANTYPILTAGTDSKPTLIVNTDNEFTYLGRLVVDFNAAGEINVAGLAGMTSINGAYAATTANVEAAWAAEGGLAAAFADGTKGEEVADLTDAVQSVISTKDGNVSGFTDVYLQGERIAVRNQETNLGNLTADANGAALKDALGTAAATTFVVSLKNGGGIRAQIGSVSSPDPVTGEVDFLPPQANTAASKPAGAVSQLDIENSLRFNNTLMAFDTTAAGLKAILEHGVAVLGNQGRFPQIGGVKFSYDPTRAAGDRVRNIALIDENDNVVAAVVQNGVISSVAPTTITVVTLNFLANGGDSYPMKANGENFRYLLNDGTLSAPVDESLDFGAAVNVPVNVLGEQTALFDYMQSEYPNAASAFDEADMPIELDTRIQNLSFRSDAVFAPNTPPTITSGATASVAENTTAVTTVTATDADFGETLTYSISGGADAALFSINASTGALTFLAAPNFEAAADAGANNVYDVQVSVTDGNHPAVTQDIAVTVTNVNEAPVITSGATATVNEANTNGVTGSQSSASPYLTSTNSNVQFTSILTVGDAVGGYRMVGIPDGMGAYDNGDGTFTLLINHELNNTVGVPRAHGQRGAFVSQWVINKSTLQVISIRDFLRDGTSVYLSNNNQSTGTAHSAYLAAATTLISRLCSADLAPVGAYQWTDTATETVYGTAARIFQSGEESGGSVASPFGPEANILFGRQFAFVATDDPNTALNEANTAWELPHAGLFAWENNLASPFAQRKTIVAGMDDSTGGQIYFWVGDKQTTGNVVERAGLTRQSAADALYVVKVSSLTPDGTGATNEDRSTPLSGSFTLENEGDVSGLTVAQLESLSDTKGGTQFFRPEDGHWDPNNPNDFYFVTTDRYDQVQDGVGATEGRSRLYRLRFNDITNPTAGGTIEALLDGSEGGNMFDNMTVTNTGKVILQEDVGNQQHLGKIWEYDIATDTLTELAQHDRARFGDVGVAQTAPFSQDEESSGVIDVSDILGAGSYLVNVQAHYNVGDAELVEGGQLLLMQTNVTTGQQVVTTVTATDPDAGATLTYSISGGADAGDFVIDPATGKLSFAVAPNFEAPADADANNIYNVEVSVSDGTNPAAVQMMAVTVSAVNEAPVNTTAEAVNVAENTTAVTTATGTDAEGATLTFAISGGADGAKFTINAATGELSFIAAPNFEAPTDNGANNSYFVTVTVSDGVNAPVNKTVVVTVTNANEAPSITSGAAFNVAENTTAVTTVTATDPDAGATLTFAISGGADAALFSINASTGALTFLAAPNFEAPGDAGTNNVYDVQVSASDGTIAVTQDLAVTVTNVNESPAITSGAAFNVAENTTAVTTVIATDPDAGTMLTYSISGGADAALFSINASTGALTFLVAPDFETPTDAGTNNVYEVQVSVSDGVNPAVTQNVTVTVTNVDETTGLTYSLAGGVLSVVGTSGDDIITVFNDAGAIKIDNNGSIIDTGATAAAVTGVSISGLAGNDTLKIDLSLGAAVLGSLLGGDGDDLLISGRGNDLLNGGADNDEASFIQAASGVNVYLATNDPQNTAGAGIDRLVQVENVAGSNFDDRLFGNSGSNRLRGGTGNDIIDGLGGADQLDGGAGNDTLTFDHLDTSVSGGADNDRSFVASGAGAVNYNLVTGQMEIVYANNSTANNLFDATGASFGVTIIGGSGNDTITGGNGNDQLTGGAGADAITGNGGNDSLDGGTGADALNGGAGNDYLTFDHLDTSVIGGADFDRSLLTASPAAVNYNLVSGQMEIVYAQSSAQANTFDATGATFAVSIYGGSGNDTIIGGDQNDVLSGGGGADTIIGNLGNDSIDGGTGIDTVSYVTAGSSVNVNLATFRATGGAGIDGLFNLENVIGSNFDDVINGNALDNILDGGIGLDIITGGGGTDTIL